MTHQSVLLFSTSETHQNVAKSYFDQQNKTTVFGQIDASVKTLSEDELAGIIVDSNICNGNLETVTSFISDLRQDYKTTPILFVHHTQVPIEQRETMMQAGVQGLFRAIQATPEAPEPDHEDYDRVLTDFFK